MDDQGQVVDSHAKPVEGNYRFTEAGTLHFRRVLQLTDADLAIREE